MPLPRSRWTLAFSADVRALHAVAEIDQHLGDAAHADAADADEMDRSDVARHLHAVASFPCRWSCVPRPSRPDRRAGRPHRAGRSARAAAAAVGEPPRIGDELGEIVRQPVRGSCRAARPSSRRRPRASTSALAFWSWSSAWGSGTMIAGPADDRELGDGRGAGAADDEMRCGDPRRQVVEERPRARPRRRARR